MDLEYTVYVAGLTIKLVSCAVVHDSSPVVLKLSRDLAPMQSGTELVLYRVSAGKVTPLHKVGLLLAEGAACCPAGEEQGECSTVEGTEAAVHSVPGAAGGGSEGCQQGASGKGTPIYTPSVHGFQHLCCTLHSSVRNLSLQCLWLFHIV